jgi:hypothetical protein
MVVIPVNLPILNCHEYECGWYYMDYNTSLKERRRRETLYNSPGEVAARLARVRKEREIAEYHQRQEQKVWSALNE